MTVVQLANGDLFLHSPIAFDATLSLLECAKLAHFDESDEFIPFDVRQPNGVRPFSDRYALISDYYLRTFRAIRAKLGFEGVHLGPPLSVLVLPDPSLSAAYNL
jgi:hypothetical protein